MNMNTPEEVLFQTFFLLYRAVAWEVTSAPCCMNVLQVCVIVTRKKNGTTQ